MKTPVYLIFLFLSVMAACTRKAEEPAPDAFDHQVGSPTTRFTVHGNYLYIIRNQSIDIYKTSLNGSNSFVKSAAVINNMETEKIFADGSRLFLSSKTGLQIYGLTNPESPAYYSTISMLPSCYPVAVNDTLIYATLSAGTPCNGSNKQLVILNIKNPGGPKVLKSYNFVNPKGIALKGNYLYLCDANAFKILDVSDYNNIEQKGTLSLQGTDVTIDGNILVITVRTAILQYDCSDPLNLKLLSQIPVQ